MTTPDAAPAPAAVPPAAVPPAATTPPVGPTHPCIKCGRPVPIDVGLCEQCNPLGLRDSSASQVHGTVFIAVLVGFIGLAILARLSITGIGPFTAQVADVSAAGAGLAVTLVVHNDGSSAGQTTCRVTDPTDANGSRGAILLSPQIDPGATKTFSQTVTELGTTVRPLTVQCSAP